MINYLRVSAVFVFIIFLIVNTTIYSQESSQDALILFKTQKYSDLKVSLDKLKRDGALIKFVYPPNLVIANLRQPLGKDDYAKYGIEKISYEVENPKEYTVYGKGIVDAIFAWNNNFQGLSKNKGLDKPPSPFAEPLVGDAVFEENGKYS